ncbi:MAG: hypothetical protein JWM80_2179 [Cyanobacteria bacterium RYN_339]|nr:hypothetical protein [Cyanobacteria bacterium RYN_339]
MRWLLAALVVAGCNAPLDNRAPVFQPLSGAIALKLKLPLVPDTTATYTLDDTPLPPDLHPIDNYAVVIDTTTFADGLHRLRIRILDRDRQLVQELEQTLLFRNS